MPSGKTHDRITDTTSPVIALVSIYSSYCLTNVGVIKSSTYIEVANKFTALKNMPMNLNLSFFIGIVIALSYIFAAKMFSGDLDLVSRQTRRWGWFRFIWKPYRKIFSHRSVWTHGVFRGTVVRIVYLSLWLTPLLFILPLVVDVTTIQLIKGIWNSFGLFPITYVSVFIGLLLGSASHTYLDQIVSFWKKIRPKKRKRKRRKI